MKIQSCLVNQGHPKSHYYIRQVRKCNRKLFNGARSHIKNTAKRFVKGFQRYDKVSWNGTECFVFGRRTTGYFDLRHADGTKIHPSVNSKHLILLETAKTYLIERRHSGFLPGINSEVSAA